MIYTADGGGDNAFYSAYHFDGKEIKALYGGDEAGKVGIFVLLQLGVYEK